MTCGRDSSRHPDPEATSAELRRLEGAVHALAVASAARAPQRIARLLTRDVEMLVDTGRADIPHAHRASGRRASAELLVQILEGFSRPSIVEHAINGGPGILLRDDDVLVGVVNVDVRRSTICRVWVVLNRDKLVRFDLD